MSFDESSIFFCDSESKDKRILRCPKCYLTPLIFNENSENDLYITLKCQNNHTIYKPIKEFYNESKNFQSSLIKCKNCNEINNSNLFYCTEHYDIFCKNELNSIKNKHKLIPLKGIDSCCREKGHNNYNVIYYCKTHDQNICNICKQNEHEGDQIEDFIYLKNSEIELLEENIRKSQNNLDSFSNNFKSFISNLKQIIDELKKAFDKYKENTELEILLAKDLIKIYDFKKKNNSLNYQIIQNVKNITFNNNINIGIELNQFIQIKNDLLKKFKQYFIEIKKNKAQKNKEIKKEQNNYVKIIRDTIEETKEIKTERLSILNNENMKISQIKSKSKWEIKKNILFIIDLEYIV